MIGVSPGRPRYKGTVETARLGPARKETGWVNLQPLFAINFHVHEIPSLIQNGWLG